MKKILSLTLVLIFTFLLYSCKKEEVDPLSYQSYPFSAEGSMTANDTEYVFSVEMTGKNEGKVQFTSPQGLRGYLFTVTPHGITLSYGDMTIDFSANGEKTNAVKLITDLFSLDLDKLQEKKDETQNSVDLTIATYGTEKEPVKVYINKATGQPVRFEYGATPINITSFTPGNVPNKTDIPETAAPTASATATVVPKTGN